MVDGKIGGRRNHCEGWHERIAGRENMGGGWGGRPRPGPSGGDGEGGVPKRGTPKGVGGKSPQKAAGMGRKLRRDQYMVRTLGLLVASRWGMVAWFPAEGRGGGVGGGGGWGGGGVGWTGGVPAQGPGRLLNRVGYRGPGAAGGRTPGEGRGTGGGDRPALATGEPQGAGGRGVPGRLGVGEKTRLAAAGA